MGKRRVKEKKYGTQVALIVEAINFEGKLKTSLAGLQDAAAQRNTSATQINMTRTVHYCIPHTWKHDDVITIIFYYRGVAYTFLFFTAASSLVALVHLVLWVVLLVKIAHQNDYEAGTLKLASIVRTKFGFIENLVHDIPLTVLAIELFMVRTGPRGLTCVLCASHNALCAEDKFVRQLTTASSAIFVVSLCVVGITTAWRGITVFFRWSYTKECSLVAIRGCVSIFVGLIYTVMILTPGFIVLNYRYSAVTGMSIGATSDLVSKFLIMGLLGWCVVLLGGCCCPLIRAIGS
eukprot:gene16627-18317_t